MLCQQPTPRHEINVKHNYKLRSATFATKRQLVLLLFSISNFLRPSLYTYHQQRERTMSYEEAFKL